MYKVREKCKRANCDKEFDNSSEFYGESSDETVTGVHFDNSEEEKMKEFEEGINEVVDEGLNGRVSIEPKDDLRSSEPPNNTLITNEMSKEHVIEEEYMTDELDIGENVDSCGDIPSIIKFKEDKALGKDFTFKVGMGFSSLK